MPSRSFVSRERRRAMALGYWAGALWSIGNGLTTGGFIIYLVRDLGAGILNTSLVLAILPTVGLLRLVAPVVIHAFGSPKRACLQLTGVAYVLLLAVPLLVYGVSRGDLPRSQWVVMLLIALLGLHQLNEYLGSVALWSWFAGLIPPRIRGRYFARRQVWQLVVLIPTLLAGGRFTDWYLQAHPQTKLQGYAIVVGVGALALLAALIPLALMPATIGRAVPLPPRLAWSQLAQPFRDTRFRRLLIFGCWFSFFASFTQAPMYVYSQDVLKIGLLTLSAMKMLMLAGQTGMSFWIGPFSDRYGNRPAMLLCQWLVASGPLFYFLATPEQPYWVYGAWLVWSAYVAFNVCQPNLVLKLARGNDVSPYVAAFFAATSLAQALSTIAGGYVFDLLKRGDWTLSVGSWSLDYYDVLFLGGWLTRSLGIVLLWRVIEPGAWNWRRILAGERQPTHPEEVGPWATQEG